MAAWDEAPSALERLEAKAHRRTAVESLIIDGECSGPDGLLQFRDAHHLVDEFCLVYGNLRLKDADVRMINDLIGLAREIHKSRHVSQNKHGALVLAGSNGVVPMFRYREDWIMAQR